MLGLLEEDPKKRADTIEIQYRLENLLDKAEISEQNDDGGRSTVISLNGNSQPISKEFENETYHYKGETLNGKRHGNGTCKYFQGNCVYEGSWKMNKEDGYGKLTIPPNSYYEGEYQNGKYHGQGTFLYPDGTKYTGKWRNGQKNGEGTMMYSNGKAMYTGEWKNGNYNGIGTYLYPNNAIYHGHFENGKNDGMLGELTHPNGKVVQCIMRASIKFLEEEKGNEENGIGNEQGNGNAIGKRTTKSCSNCTLI